MNSYSTSWWSLLLINRAGEDERLSWPCWLTYSGRLTHKVIIRPSGSHLCARQGKFAGQRPAFDDCASRCVCRDVVVSTVPTWRFTRRSLVCRRPTMSNSCVNQRQNQLRRLNTWTRYVNDWTRTRQRELNARNDVVKCSLNSSRLIKHLKYAAPLFLSSFISENYWGVNLLTYLLLC